MIKSFGNKLAEDLFFDKKLKEVRRFDNKLRRRARMKLLYLHEAERLKDLEIPPSNRLEKKKGDLKNHYAIWIDTQWRIVFLWKDGDANDVKIVDYH